MNSAITVRKTDGGRRLLALCLVAGMVVTSGCAGLRQRREDVQTSGFLGDYSKLAKNEDYPAYLIYINPAAQWSKYDAVMIDSVSLWANDESLSPEDRSMIAGFMYNALTDTLGKNFKLVGAPGMGVLRLRAAITQAEGSKVVLNVVTSIVPQLRVVTTLGGMAADTSALVGEASGELEIVDSVTGERLAAGVDRQTGTKALIRGGNKFSSWGDVKAACEYWSERIDKFLVERGVRTNPKTEKK